MQTLPSLENPVSGTEHDQQSNQYLICTSMLQNFLCSCIMVASCYKEWQFGWRILSFLFITFSACIHHAFCYDDNGLNLLKLLVSLNPMFSFIRVVVAVFLQSNYALTKILKSRYKACLHPGSTMALPVLHMWSFPSLYSFTVHIFSITIHFSVNVESKPDSTQCKFQVFKMSFSWVHSYNLHLPKCIPGNVFQLIPNII